MTDILIRGMKMPVNCINCFAQYGGWCYVAPSEIDERVAKSPVDAVEKKPDWCPLIEVPPHGDLIDRDRLRNVFADLIPYIIDESNGLYVDGLNSAYDALCCAPTVIEASEKT